jgi:Carboxypeptidase regulatory-like domain
MDRARQRFLGLALAASALAVAIWLVLGGADSPSAGRLGLSAPPAELPFPEAVPPAMAPAEPDVQPLLPEPVAAEAELRLLIVRDGDEAPVAHVSTYVASSSGNRRARTDAAGRLRLEVPPGELRVEVAATRSTRITRVTLAGAGDQRLVVARRGGDVSGRVVDVDGEPVEAAEVLLWKTSPGHTVPWLAPDLTTITDAAGAFVVPDAAGAEGDADNFVLAARLGDRASLFELASRTSALEPVRGARLVLSMTPGVAGQVRTAAGEAVSALILARADCGTYLAWHDAQTAASPSGAWLQQDAGCSVQPVEVELYADDSGRFQLPGVPDRWRVEAHASGAPPARVERDAALDSRPIDIVLSLPVMIFGTVRDASRAPAREARVTLETPDSRGGTDVDEAGNWRLEGASPGAARLTVSAPDCATWREDIDLAHPPPMPHDIVLQPGLALAGLAQDARGQPLLALPVWLTRQLPDAWPSDRGPAELERDVCSTANGGRFRFANLSAGSYRVELRTRDHTEVLAVAVGSTGDTELHLVAGEGLDLVARISGRVVDAGGVPQAAVLLRVQAWADAEARFRTLETNIYPDETARFTLPDMAPGWMQLDVWALPDLRMPAAAWERARGEPLTTLGPLQVQGGTQEVELRLTR